MRRLRKQLAQLLRPMFSWESPPRHRSASIPTSRPPPVRRRRIRRARRGAGLGPRLPRDRRARCSPACPLSPGLSRRPGTALAVVRSLGRGGSWLFRRLHGGRGPAGLSLVPDALPAAAGFGPGTGAGTELDLGTGRWGDPVGAALQRLGAARRARHGPGRPSRWNWCRDRSGIRPGRVRPDPARRGLPRRGSSRRPGPEKTVAGALGGDADGGGPGLTLGRLARLGPPQHADWHARARGSARSGRRPGAVLPRATPRPDHRPVRRGRHGVPPLAGRSRS